jgi:hypothetical protein
VPREVRAARPGAGSGGRCPCRYLPRAAELAERQGIGAPALLANGIVDAVVPERPDAADDPDRFLRRLAVAIGDELARLRELDPARRTAARRAGHDRPELCGWRCGRDAAAVAGSGTAGPRDPGASGADRRPGKRPGPAVRRRSPATTRTACGPYSHMEEVVG